MSHHRPEEKRASPRVRASFHLHLVYDDLDQLVESYSHDISEGGIFVKTDSPMPVGSRVQLKISIVHQELQYINAVGEVVHSTEKNGGLPPTGMGIRFVEIDEESKQFLKDFVVSNIGTETALAPSAKPAKKTPATKKTKASGKTAKKTDKKRR